MTSSSPQNSKRPVVTAAKITLFVLLLVVFFHYFPIQNIWRELKGVSIFYFGLAVTLSACVTLISAFQFSILIHKLEIGINPLKFYEINLLTRFYSFFSPFSSFGSLLRWQQLSAGGKSAESLAALFINRALEIVIVIAMGLFWGLVSISHAEINIWLISCFLFLFMVIIWFMFHAAPRLSEWVKGRSNQAKAPLAREFYQWMARLFSAFAQYKNLSAMELLQLVIVGIIVEVFSLIAYIFVAASVKLPVSIVDLGWIRSLLFLAALTPFTLTGGLGLREVGVVIILSGMGIAPELAATFALINYIRSMASSLLSGAGGLGLMVLDRDRVAR